MKILKLPPIEEAREFVHGVRLKNPSDWKIYSKSVQQARKIPSSPVIPYRKEWKGWSDWSPTGHSTLIDDSLGVEKQKLMSRALNLRR